MITNPPSQYSATSPEVADKCVLVVGHRPALEKTLERLQIPFAVWHDKPIQRIPKCLKSCTSFFPSTAKDIRRFLEQEFTELGPFTHVIAGTESSVYAASVSRRVLNARKSKDSIALRCSDKQQMKLLMRENNVPMTDFLTRSESLSPEFVFEQLGPKVVIKERKSSGGRGISFANCVEDVAARKDRSVLYERFVNASEMSIETFVRGGEIQFTNTTNYLVSQHANIVPANIPEPVLAKALAINRQVIEALDLVWGLTHAEFYWTDDFVLFGEVGLRPPGGYIMECMSIAFGLDAWEAFVATELDLDYVFPNGNVCTSGVAMLHAGEGTLVKVQNVEEVESLPTCVRFKLLVKPGDQVQTRTAVSEVSAYGLFAADAVDATVSDVRRCLERVRFEMKES